MNLFISSSFICIFPNDLIFSIKVFTSFSSLSNLISIFIERYFDISFLILFISLILFSIFMHELINEFNLRFLSSHLFWINFPFSNEIFILFGNFSLFWIKSSLKYILSYSLSIVNKIWSSFSFNALLILVNIFCTCIFNSSLSLIIFSYISFKFFIFSSNFLDKFSK